MSYADNVGLDSRDYTVTAHRTVTLHDVSYGFEIRSKTGLLRHAGARWPTEEAALDAGHLWRDGYLTGKCIL